MTGRKLDVEKFRQMLLDHRARFQAQARRLRRRSSLADQSDEVSELADYDDHPADVASETFEREKALAIDENVDDLIARVDRAIEKIDAGTYGICDRCGNGIGRARLEALPYAAFCIECQDIVDGR